LKPIDTVTSSKGYKRHVETFFNNNRDYSSFEDSRDKPDTSDSRDVKGMSISREGEDSRELFSPIPSRKTDTDIDRSNEYTQTPS